MIYFLIVLVVFLLGAVVLLYNKVNKIENATEKMIISLSDVALNCVYVEKSNIDGVDFVLKNRQGIIVFKKLKEEK